MAVGKVSASLAYRGKPHGPTRPGDQQIFNFFKFIVKVNKDRKRMLVVLSFQNCDLFSYFFCKFKFINCKLSCCIF